MFRHFFYWIFLTFLTGCQSNPRESDDSLLAQQILQDSTFTSVKAKALEVVESGFNAGDGYGEVWIRDYNTFIDLSSLRHDKEVIKENLRVFFRLQGADGNIVDGFIPKGKAVQSEGGYTYIHTALETQYAGHKNTVETDQESSLVQAVFKYVQKSGDNLFLQEKIADITVVERLKMSMSFLIEHRLDSAHGLLWGATTADWGDVQPEHEWGVYLTDDTHYAIDIYDNAMFLIALDNLIDMLDGERKKWKEIRKKIANNAMEHLWDQDNEKFIPHLYLGESPFPPEFDENQIYYHGGTAVAIQAGLLDSAQVRKSLKKMRANVEASGAASIGLTLYPPYPAGYYKNEGMYPYGYQNGGDWTWFGARMVLALVDRGMIQEAYQELRPMVERVVANDGFYEWYTVDNKPTGSGTFRGSAGVLYDAILALEAWAAKAETETIDKPKSFVSKSFMY